ncbi:MAG: hypothetical protein FD135_1268 [Comamonadaceae bacterium]|nr:MAG: hypothetical protein FD135_1268 [Comamonadaceae bacterium]
MSHHTIVCRLGIGDAVAVQPSRQDTLRSDVQFIDDGGNLKFGLGHTLQQLAGWGLVPSEVSIDLAIIASALTAADTRISRMATSQDHWTREIELHVPVSNEQLWSAQAQLLSKTLQFLTGDRWAIHFRARPDGLGDLAVPTEELPMFAPDSVCLFSGGLDSFIGAVDLLSEEKQPLFVSHWWDTMTSKHQNYCMGHLVAHFNLLEFRHLKANVGFDHVTLQSSGIEDTLRGRSFLFFALASVAASAINSEVIIHVPENGLISLNVPLDPLRLGALSTRTTHPYYMARFNELLHNLGLNSKLHNRYRHKTKGQMVAECRSQDFLAQHAKNTMSCSGPAKYRFHPVVEMRKLQHCGHCVPCLIRRASLLNGLGVADDTPYTIDDLHARPFDCNKAEGEHIRAFQLALARLAAKPSRARRDIFQPGPLSDHPQDLDQYQAVYVTGMREVQALLDGVVSVPLS